MSFTKKEFKVVYLLIFYFLVWIILFEFLLPVNKILPKPSIVITTFDDLFTVYNLHLHLLSTTGVIYVSMISAYIVLMIAGSWLSNSNFHLVKFIESIEWFSKYVPGIVLAFFLIMWFPGSELIEFVFAFFTSFFSLLFIFNNEKNNVKDEYLSAAESLGANKKEIYKSVILKSIQPSIINHLKTLHFYLWALLIAYEFIKGGFGVGSMLNEVLNYSDLSALFSTVVITGVIIGIGSIIISFIEKKYFSWDS